MIIATTCVFPAFAANGEDIVNEGIITDVAELSKDKKEQAIKLVETFISESYAEYYDILNFDSEVSSVLIEGNIAEVVVKTNFKKMLKVSDASQLPYIKGMTTSVTNLEKQRSKDAVLARFVLDEQVDAVSEYIGEVQNQNEMFKVTFNITEDDLSNATLEVLGLDEYIPAKYFAPSSFDELYENGLENLQKNVDNTRAALAITNPELNLQDRASLKMMKNTRSIKYDRIAARDYANTYTSECGNSYNTDYWNPAYAWHTENGGVDCANYVSQAIHAGGIPTDDVWKPESIAWVNTGRNNKGGLSHYMVNSGYFKKTTRNSCAAGGFISHTDFSHVLFVVKNDTIDLLFSSHTADRLEQSFKGNYYKDFDYYYINSEYCD